HTRFSRDWSSDVCSSDLHVYEPAMTLDDAVDGGEPQSRTLAGRFGREEWLEHFVAHVGRDSHAGVGHANAHVVAGFGIRVGSRRSEERRVGGGDSPATRL